MPNIRDLEERAARWANILAVFPGTYCAYAIWDQRHSGALVQVNQGLVVAVVFFLVCVALGAVLNFARRPTKKTLVEPVQGQEDSAEIDRLTKELDRAQLIIEHFRTPWHGYDSEVAWRASVNEQNRLIELGRSVDDLLTPMQIEIMRLRKDLACWYLDLPECPVMDMAGIDNDNADPRTKAHNRKLSDWSERIRHGYAVQFAPKVLEIAHRLGADGIDVQRIEARSASVGNADEVSEVIIELWDLAMQA